jgi:sporulation protein YlmC with PRC-barrel domain
MIKYGLKSYATRCSNTSGHEERRKKMKRIMTLTALILAFGLVFMFANAYAASGMSKDRFRSFEVSKFIGAKVTDSTGVWEGTIQDFVLDSNGHIDFVILSRDFYNFNTNYIPYYPVPPQTVAVPFSAIRLNLKEKIALLKFSGSKLDFAPTFMMSDLSNRKWVEKDYKYYGLQPYWTEGRYARRMSSTMNRPMSEQMMRPYTMREQQVKKYIWGYSPNSDSYMDSYHW